MNEGNLGLWWSVPVFVKVLVVVMVKVVCGVMILMDVVRIIMIVMVEVCEEIMMVYEVSNSNYERG